MTRAPAGLAVAMAMLVLPAAAAAQEFEGRGSESTRPFSLAAGVAVFEAEHEGEGPFRVRLVDEQGNVVDEIASATGRFGGAKSVRVPATAVYVLDVSATGEWTVRLRSNSPELGRNAAVDSAVAAGTRDGRAAGDEPGTFGNFLGGLVAGTLTGPIGTVLVARRATGAADADAQRAIQALEGRPVAYVTSYRDAYREQLGARKRRSAIFGGVLGTGILVFTILQLVDLGGTDTGPMNGGNPNPAIVVPIFRF